ncbi:MAG: 3-hydroxyacyl-CoA dehydrogenase family protein [Alphaproteobacteria bacterium]|nr:3-hydroxyacyl-CoA dehydrogenase family protein [Alphaproteobacteria bacterium]
MQAIAVIGAGTMGHGIAQVCAVAGHPVHLIDRDEAVLARARTAITDHLARAVEKGKLEPAVRTAALDRITTTTSLAEGVHGAHVVVEAVPEDLELKRRVLAEAERAAPVTAILASNTSSLSIARLAQPLMRPGRLLGTHFFNPVPVMTLLEVVRGEATEEAVVDEIRQLGAALGKEVIVVRDAPGFATSRLGVALGMEAIRMVQEGVASAEDIDKAMVLGYRHPLGPLRLTDLVGLDVRMAIGTYLADALGNAAFEPPQLMRDMVAEGRLGKKSGEGFYRW